MHNILILYSTTDGHTLKICLRIQQIVEKQANDVTLDSIDNTDEYDLNSFDKIIIGASIRYGKHSPQVYAFINQNMNLLDRKPNAFFSVNLVARKAGKNKPETNPYFRIFLKHISWRPKKSAVFAGKLNYQLYSFWDRSIIRLIMWITKGPTDPETNKEFTNWNDVEDFARVICEM